MKKIILLLLLVSNNLKAQNWTWAKNSLGFGEGNSVATDAQGNVYEGGFFGPQNISFEGLTLTSDGFYDIFLIKYNRDGNVVWVKSAGGVGFDYAFNIAIDNLDNIYVTGSYSSPITFGTFTLLGSGLFLAKYDSTGGFVWAKNSIGDFYSNVATDNFGNIFLTGSFSSDSISFGNYTLTNSLVGFSDFFLVKYNSIGDVIWAKSAGGNNNDEGTAITTDTNGNIYVTGGYSSDSIIFGTDTLLNPYLDYDDLFLAKYDSSGNIIWVRSNIGPSFFAGQSVTTDNANNIYLTGAIGYSFDITFDSITLLNDTVGGVSVFLVKYNPEGNVSWVRTSKCNSVDIGYDVATDSFGNIYMTGKFSQDNRDSLPIQFDSIILPFPSGANDPMFIVKYDSSGNLLCATELASGGDDQNSIAINNQGDIYIGGDYYGVNPFIVGTFLLPNDADENVFVAKFSCDFGEGTNELINIDESDFNISPNPTDGNFTITASVNIQQIEVINLLGEKVFTLQCNTSNQNLHLTSLSKGVYFIRIKTPTGLVMKKVVVE